MENLNHEADSRVQKLHDFIKNYKIKNKCDDSIFSGHNIYLIKSEDRDGNITGEAFALNVTTNNYFHGQWGSSPTGSTYGYITDIYVGDGEYGVNEDVDVTDTTLRHMTYSYSATNISDKVTQLHSSTIYWDNDKKVQYADAFVISGYFDYNLNGITEDFNITEIGCRTSEKGSSSNLATHALLYDENGNRMTFVKHMNEKVTISVYIRVYYKPGYIEQNMFNNKCEFAFNPWSFIGFGWSYTTGYVYNHVINTCGYVAAGYISSTRFSRSSSGSNKFEPSDTGFYKFINKSMYGTLDGEYENPDTVLWSVDCSKLDSLIEAQNRMIDKIVVSGSTDNQTSNPVRGYYSAMIGISKEIHLAIPEEIITEWAHTLSINSGSMVGCFGTYENSTVDVRGLLPVANLKVTSIKSYNGLTHEWDIDESFTNGTNDYNLSAMYLYTWCGMFMHCPYDDQGIIKYGRQFVRIYCNVHTEYPITDLTNISDQVWCSDTFWDITSWQLITDNHNMSTTEGTKKYYMAFGGNFSSNSGLPNSNYYPLIINRSGYTEPTLISDNPTRIDDIDPADGTTEYTRANYMTGYYRPARKFISNDTMGYIWMANHVWYPDVNGGDGKVFTIQTSDPVGPSGTTPSTSLRFGESTGHRILQFFRGSAYNAYERICLSKLVVFDLPNEAAIEADPTLEPTEYIINTTMPSVCTNYDTKITTTERGYVIIGDAENNRVHIVNILGDANSNYEPYEYILKYPDTEDEVGTSMCFAIKYTTHAVFYNPRTTTAEVEGFTVIDLTDNSIVDEFTIEKGYWDTLKWITGVSDVLFLTGPVGSNLSGDWRSYIYDLNRPSGSRLVQPNYSSTLSKSLMPCGDRTADLAETNHFNPHISGDEECIVTQYIVNNTTTKPYFWYINLDDYTNPIDILDRLNFSNGQNFVNKYVSDAVNFTQNKVEIFKINDGKQRVMIIDTPSIKWDNSYTYRYTYVFDANLIRDEQLGPEKTNAAAAGVPSISNDWTSSSYTRFLQPLRTTTMFRGKILMSEYTPYCDSRQVSYDNYRYWRQPGNRNRWIDPKRMLPHKMTGTTTTFQTWNNPKRIYGFNGFSFSLINSKDIWNPTDLNNQTPSEIPDPVGQ